MKYTSSSWQEPFPARNEHRERIPDTYDKSVIHYNEIYFSTIAYNYRYVMGIFRANKLFDLPAAALKYIFHLTFRN